MENIERRQRVRGNETEKNGKKNKIVLALKMENEATGQNYREVYAVCNK